MISGDEMKPTNEELIEVAKVQRDLSKRQVLAQAIVRLDERVAETTATHEMRIGSMMSERDNLLKLMDQFVPEHELNHIVEEYSH